MPLSIKNERVSQLARELARLTGESITDAVGHAVESRIAEIQKARSREGIAEQLMAIAERCVEEAPPGWLSRDFDGELYDEHGLPG